MLLGLGEPIRELPADGIRGFAAAGGHRRAACSRRAAWSLQGPSFTPRTMQTHPASWSVTPAFERLAAPGPVRTTRNARRAARSNFLWSTFTRFDPAADVHAARTELIGSHPAFHAPILIDARMKAGYPEELFCDEATAERVDSRWRRVFPGRGGRDGRFGPARGWTKNRYSGPWHPARKRTGPGPRAGTGARMSRCHGSGRIRFGELGAGPSILVGRETLLPGPFGLSRVSLPPCLRPWMSHLCNLL